MSVPALPPVVSHGGLRTLPGLPSRRGTLIAFEGLDRSGKSTQCALLISHLRSQGQVVEHMRFPNRSTPIGQMINAYLTGESQAEDHVIHLLFSANRWESAAEIERLIRMGRTVVLDRYYYSGCVYSAAKSVPGMDLGWCRKPEVGLPRPDICIFLDVSAEIAEQRGGFGAERYENKEMQRIVRELFEEMRQGPQEKMDMVVIDAGRDVNDVADDVKMAVKGSQWQVEHFGDELGKVKGCEGIATPDRSLEALLSMA